MAQATMLNTICSKQQRHIGGGGDYEVGEGLLMGDYQAKYKGMTAV